MVTFGASSYAVLSALYALLAILLLTSWRGPRIGAYLIIACVVSSVWGGVLAWEMATDAVSPTALFYADALRAASWLTFLAQAGLSRGLRNTANAIWIVILAAGSWVWVSNRFLGTVGDINSVMIPGGLALSLVGLVLIEQLFRNAPPAARSSLKALVLGLGGVFAYDLFLYSQGVLFSEIDPAAWMARGAANVLFVPLIALAARRNPLWELNIFVSRQVVFYTTTLIAVGLYLLMMSFGGYLLLLYGGTWGGVARMLFFAGAVLVLITLLFSSSLRARFKVFLSKHFFQNRYDYRDEWLRLVATLADFEDSSTRQVVIKAMAQIVESPAGVLWTKDPDDGAFVVAAAYETEDSVANLESDCPLVQFICKDGWIVDLEEYAAHPDRYENLELPGWLANNPRVWLIVPLLSRGDLVGLVMLYRAPGSLDLNYEDRDLLKTVGNHIAVHLAQEKSDSLLAQAQQFDAYNRLTAFLMHDLKNLIAQQSLIVENAEKHKSNPEFIDDALETISSGVTRMRRVIEHLRQSSVAPTVERVELGKLILQCVSQCEDRRPVPRALIADSQVWVRGDRDRLQMALNHAIRNAQDATSADGSIDVVLDIDDGMAAIEIKDTGSGMDDTFVRDRLFRPFDSTKGTQGVGIGAYQVRETVRSMGGQVAVSSIPGSGTCVAIALPTDQSQV